MGFTNVTFLFFFLPLSIIFYYIVLFMGKKIKSLKKSRLSDLVIIAFSLLFYAWALTIDAIKLILYILLISIFGKIIEKSKNGFRKIVLIFSIILVLSILFLYKYLGVFIDTSNVNLIAPLGLSFITFYAISYLVDIYRKDAIKGKIIDTYLYFTFFPKVISGPIVLWKNFKKQIKKREYNTGNFLEGINLLIIGFAKKLIIADTFGLTISKIQNYIGFGIDSLTALGMLILFSFQIYYDFSGYSDIAIGISKMFGFNFEKNFDYPYTATSIKDFWKRWHISLGNWFKEYVYIPLGGNRKGIIRTLLNLLAVFLLTGIWHGAGLTYIIWGIFHGILRMIEKIIDKKRFYIAIPNFVKRLFIIIFVFLGWEFFMFKDIDSIINFNSILLGSKDFYWIPLMFKYFFDSRIIFLIIVSILGCFIGNIKYIKNMLMVIKTNKFGFVVYEMILFALFFISIMFMVNSSYNPFIYFQY